MDLEQRLEKVKELKDSEARAYAEEIFPGGCKCTDDSGDCDWCDAYYAYLKGWI